MSSAVKEVKFYLSRFLFFSATFCLPSSFSNLRTKDYCSWEGDLDAKPCSTDRFIGAEESRIDVLNAG